MTSAPTDLLALRLSVIALTGLSGNAVGIVGDTAHAAGGGYHEGRTDLVRAGVWLTDYSVRLPRDRGACTDSASAMDIGYQWPRGGTAAWLRFNARLVTALRAGDTALASVRAVNYSPDGSHRFRIDRQYGFTTESSGDDVTIHTHIEWYRDSEGKRAAAIDRITDLIKASIGLAPLKEVDVTPEEHDRLVNIDLTCNALIRAADSAPLTVGTQANVFGQQVAALGKAVAAMAVNVSTLISTANTLTTQVAQLVTTVQRLAAAGTSADTAVILTAVNNLRQQLAAAAVAESAAMQQQPPDTP